MYCCCLPRTAMSYRNILNHAFCRLHGCAQLKTLEQQFNQSDEVLPTSAFLQQLGSTELYHKELRVKSFKTYQWLLAQDSWFRLFLCVSIIRPFERMMHLFMAWQRDDAFLSPTPPLVQMCRVDDSPCMEAIKELHGLMTSGCFKAHTVTLHQLAQRGLAHLEDCYARFIHSS